MKVEKFEHEDGRTCTYAYMTGEWFHWDENPIKGPREKPDYKCTRAHPGDSSRYKIVDETDPVRVSPSGSSDRGDFGMPTIGGSWVTIGPGELRLVPDDDVPVGPKQERVCNIMDEAQALYKRKAAGYRGVEGDLADHLGVKGQFVDINRKFWKIKAMLWDEVVPMYPDAGAGEDVEEILMDFIGHAALTIDFIRQSNIKESMQDGEGKA